MGQLRRACDYYKKNGLLPFYKKVIQKIGRARFLGLSVLYVYECSDVEVTSVELPAGMTMHQYQSLEEIPQDKREELAAEKGGMQRLLQDLKRRFTLGKNGVTLWLLCVDEKVVALRWHCRGHFSQNEAFPLTRNDVFMFSGETFPAYRGQGLLTTMFHCCVQDLKKEGVCRIFSSVDIWNYASHRMCQKTGYKEIGRYRECTIFSKSFVLWSSQGAEDLESNH